MPPALYYPLFLYIVIVLSAVFHEYAHGWMAKQLGDSTAERMGRLTLNPFAHIDLFGTVIVPLFLVLTSGIFIGWAKPVPYNPYNLRDQRYGNLKVAIAGPVTNILIALAIGLVVRLAPLYQNTLTFMTDQALGLLGFVVLINIYLALFNLIPVPPLDGSKVLGDLFPRAWGAMQSIGIFGLVIALFLAFFILGPLADFILRLILADQSALVYQAIGRLIGL